MRAAERAIEEHEEELLNELFAQMERGISEGATVAEAVAEMRKAVFEDPETRELAERVWTLMFFGDGEYLRSKLLPAPGFEPPDVETKYTLRGGPDRHLLSEEIKLLKRISDAVHERLPADLPEDEKLAQAQELVSEDPELSAIMDRLEELAEGRKPLWRTQEPEDEDDQGV